MINVTFYPNGLTLSVIMICMEEFKYCGDGGKHLTKCYPAPSQLRLQLNVTILLGFFNLDF